MSKYISWHPQCLLIHAHAAVSRRKYNKPSLGIDTGLLTTSCLLQRNGRYNSMCAQWWGSACGLQIMKYKRLKSPQRLSLHFHSAGAYWEPAIFFLSSCFILQQLQPSPWPFCTVLSHDQSLTFNLGVALLLEHLSDPESGKSIRGDETVKRQRNNCFGGNKASKKAVKGPMQVDSTFKMAVTC